MANLPNRAEAEAGPVADVGRHEYDPPAQPAGHRHGARGQGSHVEASSDPERRSAKMPASAVIAYSMRALLFTTAV